MAADTRPAPALAPAAAARPRPGPSALQRRVHGLLDGRPRPGDRLDAAVHHGLFGAIVVAVAAMVVGTVPSVAARWGAALAALDLALGAVFLAEYAARLWTAPADPRYGGRLGRLRYACTPMALLDLAAVVALLLPQLPVDLRQARVIRLFSLLRVGKLGRSGRALAMFQRVFVARRADLLMAAGVVASLLLVGSTLVYFAEHEAQPDKFGSIPEALWWGVATVTTVGYGDVTPVTAFGRVLGGLVAVFGIASFALPTAILGAAFLDELQRARALEGRAECPTCGHPCGGAAPGRAGPDHTAPDAHAPPG